MADVPNAPGVPVVAGGFNGAAPPSLVTSDVATPEMNSDTPQWGIFDTSGNPVLVGDSTVTFSYTHEWRVSDYPIEDGGFKSYNKVEMPFEGKITFAVGGSVNNKTDFINNAEALCGVTTLVDMATPEVTYKNVNPYHVGYDRSAVKGAGLIQVDVWVKAIRVAPAVQFSQTQQPSGADQVNDGTVAPQLMPEAQQKGVSAAQSQNDPTVN